jgi:hypothetical protein
VSEEARAIAHRASQRRRAAVPSLRRRALAGNGSLRTALIANWQPVIDWLRERQIDGKQAQ